MQSVASSSRAGQGMDFVQELESPGEFAAPPPMVTPAPQVPTREVQPEFPPEPLLVRMMDQGLPFIWILAAVLSILCGLLWMVE